MKKQIEIYTCYSSMKIMTFDGTYLHVYNEGESNVMLLITKDIWNKMFDEYLKHKQDYYEHWNGKYCGVESLYFKCSNSKMKLHITEYGEFNDETDEMTVTSKRIKALIVNEFELDMEHG